MTCDEFKDKFHERLRGALGAEERARLDAHVGECEDCRDFEETCRELTCKEFVDFLHAYLDRELSTDRAATFERHLAVCPDCTTYLAKYREAMDLSVTAMKDLPAKLPSEIPEDLVRAILDARTKND